MQDSIRKSISETIKNAASRQKLSVHADAAGFVSQIDFLCINTPISEIEKINVKNLLEVGGPLDDKPIMFWYLSGEQLEQSKRLPSGYYTVVAHVKRGTVSLHGSAGEALGEGILSIGVSNSPVEPLYSFSAGIDTFKVGKNSVKICGHVSVDGPFGAKVSVSGCIEVQN